METVKITVKGMTCGHCKMSVENALKELDGVESAEVSLDDENVTVIYDESKLDVTKMKETIDDIGFDAV